MLNKLIDERESQKGVLLITIINAIYAYLLYSGADISFTGGILPFKITGGSLNQYSVFNILLWVQLFMTVGCYIRLLKQDFSMEKMTPQLYEITVNLMKEFNSPENPRQDEHENFIEKTYTFNLILILNIFLFALPFISSCLFLIFISIFLWFAKGYLINNSFIFSMIIFSILNFLLLILAIDIFLKNYILKKTMYFIEKVRTSIKDIFRSDDEPF